MRTTASAQQDDLDRPPSGRGRAHRAMTRARASGLTGIAGLMAMVLLALSAGPLARQATPAAVSLGLTVNDSAIGPGETLTVGVSVVNTPGTGFADFVFAILLPDGSTVVSAGPGVGARFGRFGDLRTLVPVARGISLGPAFEYQNAGFFSHTFTGVEPLGTYRLFFAALRTGALADGVVGPGELLALATAEVLVAPGPVGRSDPTRQVTATVTPAAGGTLETTAADGTVLALAVPADAVRQSTAISIAPLVAVDNLPAGTLVAGINAGPAGLRFDAPATLTITLPEVPPILPTDYVAMVVDAGGRNAEVVPLLPDGAVLRLSVTHFSDVFVVASDAVARSCDEGVFGDIMTPEWRDACAFLRGLFNEARNGLAMGATLDDVMEGLLEPFVFTGNPDPPQLASWIVGLIPRLQAATGPQPPSREVFLAAVDEWLAWMRIYGPVYGEVADRTNAAAGRRGGALIDQAQAAYREMLIADMNRQNLRCTADRANAATYVDLVSQLPDFWIAQFPGDAPITPPWELQYCVFISIDAAPPPVLTPGTTALVPVSIRARVLAPGGPVDFDGQTGSVAIAATNASVQPPGGIIPLPVEGNVQLTPQGSQSTITISVALVDEPFSRIPTRTRTFEAGQPPTLPLPVTSSHVRAAVQASWSGHQPVTINREAGPFATSQSVLAEMDETRTVAGVAFRALSRSQNARSVGAVGDVVTIHGSGTETPALEGGVTQTAVGASTSTPFGTKQSVCFQLPVPHQAVFTASESVRSQDGRSGENIELTIGGHEFGDDDQTGTFGGSVMLPSGPACVALHVGSFSCGGGNAPISCDDPTPFLWSYTVTLSPQP